MEILIVHVLSLIVIGPLYSNATKSSVIVDYPFKLFFLPFFFLSSNFNLFNIPYAMICASRLFRIIESQRVPFFVESHGLR